MLKQSIQINSKNRTEYNISLRKLAVEVQLQWKSGISHLAVLGVFVWGKFYAFVRKYRKAE
jgi:hypothetical protein